MLLYPISDINYAPKYTQFKLGISTIQGWVADGPHHTVIRSYHIDLCSDTELQIKVNNTMVDDAYLSKVVDHKKSWFTLMEVLDQIYHHWFFSTKSLGRQPMTSQYFQPLTSQKSLGKTETTE